MTDTLTASLIPSLLLVELYAGVIFCATPLAAWELQPRPGRWCTLCSRLTQQPLLYSPAYHPNAEPLPCHDRDRDIIPTWHGIS